MIGVYFSGTGNTKHCVEKFMREYDPAGETISIEAENAVQEICRHSEIIIGYPVQFSNIPKILQDFIADNSYIWKGKKVFIIATMGLFSGDGAGILARLLTKHGAIIIGGLHLKMPDSIGDEKALKRTLVQNQELVRKAEQKIEASAQKLKDGHPSQDGMGCLNHLAGLFGQRLYFCSKTKAYSDKLKMVYPMRKMLIALPYEKHFFKERKCCSGWQMYHVLSLRQFLPDAGDYFVG